MRVANILAALALLFWACDADAIQQNLSMRDGVHLAAAEEEVGPSPFDSLRKKGRHGADAHGNGKKKVAPAQKAIKPLQNQPLLPVAPLTPAAPDYGTMEMQRTTEYTGQLAAYSAELSMRVGELVLIMRWVVYLSAGFLLICVVALLCLRAQTTQMRRVADIAKMNADATARNTTLARQVAEMKVRAYVFSQDVKGELLSDASRAYVVRLEAKNFGATPAHAITGWLAAYVDAAMDENAMPPETYIPQMANALLPPQSVCYFYAQTDSLTAEQIHAVKSGAKAIYAYGEINYRDAFQQERHSRFRLRCSGEQNFLQGNFAPCLAGNEAD